MASKETRVPLRRALLAPEQTKQVDVWVVGCG